MFLRRLILAALILAPMTALAQQPSAADKLLLAALQMQQVGVELQKAAGEIQSMQQRIDTMQQRSAELENLCGESCKTKADAPK